MISTKIIATHYCLPPKVLDHRTLVDRFGEKAMNSITKMSGVENRRVVSDGICASDLAFEAANRILLENNINRESIDWLIFISETPDYQSPPTSCVLHHRLELAAHCGTFDVNLGCSAFPYGISMAASFIESGRGNRVLLLIADALTPVIHPSDRGLVPLHGDGAAAVLLEGTHEKSAWIKTFVGTDGSGYKHLMIPASGARNPRSSETKIEHTDDSGITRTAEHLYMNGPAVFQFAVYKVPEVIREALKKFELAMEDIDLVLLHQANKTMIDLIYKSLKVPNEKQFLFLKDIGNTAAAASPILLAEALRQGKIKPKSKTLIASFGVGLSWSVAVISWPEQIVGLSLSSGVEYKL